jgi:hypothetical protein
LAPHPFPLSSQLEKAIVCLLNRERIEYETGKVDGTGVSALIINSVCHLRRRIESLLPLRRIWLHPLPPLQLARIDKRLPAKQEEDREIER